MRLVLLAAFAAIAGGYLRSWGVIDVDMGVVKAMVLSAVAPHLHAHVEGAWGLIPGSTCGWLDTSEFIIISAHVVTPVGEIPAAVKVQGGIIRDILPLGGSDIYEVEAAIKLSSKATVLNFGNSTVSPGLIDVHTHMNEPGREDWEGMVTGTQSAAAGGITLVTDMPLNSAPAMTTPELVDDKIKAAAGKLYTNVAMWGGLVPKNARDPETLKQMAKKGVIGFKSFLSPSGINDFPNSSIADVAAAFPTLRELGVPIMVHAELVDDSPGEPKGDPRDYATYLATRPPSWEQNAIRGLLDSLSQDVKDNGPVTKVGFGLHIAHLSDASCLNMIQEAKAAGLPVTVETCVHYLNFAAEKIPNGDTRFKCAPPIRSAENRDLLWAGMLAGKFDILSTDHSPAPPSLKKMEQGDFLGAWGGISGLQYALPGTWHGMQARGMSASQLARLWSTAPARLLGISNVTGEISPGKRADIVVWDQNQLADSSSEGLYHKHKVTPYSGMEMHGRVLATFVAGQQVFQDGKGVHHRPCGAMHLSHPSP